MTQLLHGILVICIINNRCLTKYPKFVKLDMLNEGQLWLVYVCTMFMYGRRRRGVCKEGVFVLVVVVSKTHLELIIHTDTSNENNAWHLDFIQFLFLIYHNVVCICKKDATCTTFMIEELHTWRMMLKMC